MPTSLETVGRRTFTDCLHYTYLRSTLKPTASNLVSDGITCGDLSETNTLACAVLCLCRGVRHRACADRSRADECSARDLAMGRFTLSAPQAFRLETTPRRYLEAKEITFAWPRRATARITFDDSSPDTDFLFPSVRQEATVPRAPVTSEFPNSIIISCNPSAYGAASNL
jgi:hypothetical protein